MISEPKFTEILSRFDKIDPILVVGDIGLDKYTKGAVKRISPEAPVPIVEVFEEWTKLGLAANVSDNLQCLDVKSTICGVIGDDKNGDNLEDLLEERTLSTWGVVRCEDRITTFKERVVTDIQQVCRVDYETNSPLGKETLDRIIHRINDFADQHSAIILEDYGQGLFCEDFTSHLISYGKEHGKFVEVYPSRTTNPLFYKGANLLKPNRLESELMAKFLGYNETNIEKLSDILMDKLDLEKIIITLGAEGMAIRDIKSDDPALKFIPTVAREVFDVSGAGDTAISAIMSALVCGASLEEAAWIGNCASGVVVSKKGTALVNQTELKEFYSQLDHLQ